MITRVRCGSAGPNDDIEAGGGLNAVRDRPKLPLDSIANDGATDCFAGNEAESGDITFMRYYAQDEQLVSVDTTLAVRGGKVFAPAYPSLFVHGLAGYST